MDAKNLDHFHRHQQTYKLVRMLILKKGEFFLEIICIKIKFRLHKIPEKCLETQVVYLMNIPFSNDILKFRVYVQRKIKGNFQRDKCAKIGPEFSEKKVIKRKENARKKEKKENKTKARRMRERDREEIEGK